MRKTIAFHHARPPSLDAQAGEVEMAAARSLGYLDRVSRLTVHRVAGVSSSARAPSARAEHVAPPSHDRPDTDAPKGVRL
jgi:hypothetical protein